MKSEGLLVDGQKPDRISWTEGKVYNPTPTHSSCKGSPRCGMGMGGDGGRVMKV